MKGTILTIVITALVVVGLIVFSQSFINKQSSGTGSNLSQNWKNGILSAEEKSFSFGEVSMAKGVVIKNFKIKNIGTDPVEIAKLYTSCMCTTASFVRVDGSKKGPFGMQGHGYIPSISEVLNPGNEANIEVVFDPAAHGPAGVGRIDRVVSVENSGKSGKLDLSFSANVTP